MAVSGFTALTSPSGTSVFAEMEAFSEIFISFKTSASFHDCFALQLENKAIFLQAIAGKMVPLANL